MNSCLHGNEIIAVKSKYLFVVFCAYILAQRTKLLLQKLGLKTIIMKEIIFFIFLNRYFKVPKYILQTKAATTHI